MEQAGRNCRAALKLVVVVGSHMAFILMIVVGARPPNGVGPYVFSSKINESAPCAAAGGQLGVWDWMSGVKMVFGLAA